MIDDEKAQADRAKLVENERTKLSATALNGVAVTSVAAGFVTPLVALTYGVPGSGAGGAALTTISAVAWLATGIGLHVMARKLLRNLR